MIQHQKAKHFKCPQCTRRLNTAGGLSVHLWQVHKAEPGVLENTLPGRNSFEIEIYGMAGVPEPDLKLWRLRQGSGTGTREAGAAPSQGGVAKRAKVQNVALTPEQLKAQLEAHKALMNSANAEPKRPASDDSPSAAAGAVSGREDPQLTAASGSVTPAPAAEPAASDAAPAAPPVHPHKAALQKGAKSRLVYADSVLSPDERLAQMPRYVYVEPAAPPARSRPPTALAGAGAPAPHAPARPPRMSAAELF